VADPALEFRSAIDRTWLEAASSADPVAHAYALWDLDHAPDRIRFVAAAAGDETLGYLLVWLGHPVAPVVHWVGTDARLGPLADRLPSRPLVAIVPEEFRERVNATRGPARAHALLVLLASETGALPPRPEPEIRRLRAPDRGALSAWADRQDDAVVGEYAHLDPEAELVWGAFEDGRLVGAIRAAVRLPRIWVLGGVYVEPAARGEGWGRSLVETALSAARAAGAPLALYVREDRTPARTLYASLGFRSVGRRVWLDAGSGLSP